MKTSLNACVGALILAGSIAYAGPPVKMPAPNRNIHMLNAPDCPTGFLKTNVTGDPKAVHGFNCSTFFIPCPPHNSTMLSPQAKTMETGPQESVQFSYSCQYLSGQYQPQVSVPDCPTGFMKDGSSVGPRSARFACTTRPNQCPPSGAGNVYVSMNSPKATTMGTGPDERVQFSYNCSYTTVN